MIHTFKGRIVNAVKTDHVPVTVNWTDDKAFDILRQQCFIYSRIIRCDIFYIPDDHTFTFLESRDPGSHCFRCNVAQDIFLGRNLGSAPFIGVVIIVLLIFLENINTVALEHLA